APALEQVRKVPGCDRCGHRRFRPRTRAPRTIRTSHPRTSHVAPALEQVLMLRHYLTLAVKVLLRRKFFTFISLFAISFTLLVLMVATAMMDHTFAAAAPETRQDRSL